MDNNLAIYQQAKQALAEYKTVDEVKDFRDKAVAIEAYAKQANDYDLERDAAIARVRAERKCGQLLSEMQKSGGTGRGNKKDLPSGENVLPPSEYKRAKDGAGISDKQASQFQKLSAVPEKEFEEVINDPGMRPSGAQVLAIANPKPSNPIPPIDEAVLWWWGRLRDMESDDLFSKPLAELVDEMTDGMKPDAIRIIPKLIEWVKRYEQTRSTSNAA